MPKRKATNEIAGNASSKVSPPPSKKSKKQKLLEARERARLWAKQQEEQKNMDTTESSSPKRASSPKKTPSKRTPIKRATPKRTTPRKIKDSTRLTSQEPKSQRIISSSKMESIESKKPVKGKSKVAEARERARLWAKQQEDQKKKSPSLKPKKSPSLKSKLVHPTTRPIARPINNSEQEEYHTTDEEEDSDDETSVKVEKPHLQPTPFNLKSPGIQIQEGVKLNKHKVQPNPFDHSEKKNGTVKKSHNNLKSRIPRIADSSIKINIRREQQSVVRNNTNVRLTPQQSVVHNDGNAQHTAPLNKKYISLFDSFFNRGSVRDLQEEENEDWDEQQTSRKAKYLKTFFFIAVVAFFVILSQSSMLGEMKVTLPFKLYKLFPIKIPKIFGRQSITLHPCFSDNYNLSEGEMDLDSRPKCDKSQESVPCPDGGRCSNGILHSCNDKDKVLSSDGSRCVWSEETNESFAHIEAMLTNWTIKNFCELKGNKFAYKSDTKAPVFPFSMVTNSTNMKKEMLLDSSNFVFSEIDNKDMIGLSDNYVDKKLVLPTTCWVGLAAVQFLQLLGSITLQTSLKSASWILQLVYAYPIISLLSFVISLTVTSIYRHRKRQKKIANDVVEVRELAYNRMMLENSEHVVLHLRDGIAMDLHPKSRKGRAYIITKVWPRVVADVRQDNRVLKTTQRVGMKRRDVWQWIAFSQSPRK